VSFPLRLCLFVGPKRNFSVKRRTLILATGLLAVAPWVLCLRPKPVAAPAPEPAQTAEAEHPAAPRLPFTNPKAGPGLAPANSPGPTNLLGRLANQRTGLTPEQLEGYLASNRRSAGSLLAAFRTTGDKAFLKEAEEKFPHDPRVDYAAIFRSDSPEERRQWLENLKNAAPDNSLADYLCARDDFQAGQTNAALQELAKAAGKQTFQDYTPDFIQNAQEAYRAAGYTDAEAVFLATSEALLPQLAEMKQLALGVGDLAKSYRQAGDDASAQSTAQMALDLGQRFGPGTQGGMFLINNLVGIAVERIALNALDPATPLGDAGQTVQDELNNLTQRRNDIRNQSQQIEALLPAMSDQEVGAYYERMKLFGAQAAMQWVLAKSGQQ